MTDTTGTNDRVDQPKRVNLVAIRWGMLWSKKEREGRRAMVRQAVERSGSPCHTDGLFLDHLSFGLFYPGISLCMRHTGGTSTRPTRTLVGLTCRRCIRLWNRGVAEVKADRGEVE